GQQRGGFVFIEHDRRQMIAFYNEVTLAFFGSDRNPGFLESLQVAVDSPLANIIPLGHFLDCYALVSLQINNHRGKAVRSIHNYSVGEANAKILFTLRRFRFVAGISSCFWTKDPEKSGFSSVCLFTCA